MDLTMIILQIIALAMAVIFHEFMHAWTANYLGDPTGKYSKRISLNPINHVDPFGSLLLPLTLIVFRSPFILGYAKPVMINPNNFKNPKRDFLISSLAGPAANFFMALCFSIPMRLGVISIPLVSDLFSTIVFINIILMVFNLVPIPPLDGSRVLYYIFPKANLEKIEPYGIFILLLFLFVGGLNFVFLIAQSLVNLLLGI